MKADPSTPAGQSRGSGGNPNPDHPRPAATGASARAILPQPSVYLAALTALASAEATPGEVGAILAQDPLIVTLLLHSVNSAHYGLARRITDPTDAVALLGFDRVWSVLAGLVHAEDDSILAVIGAAHAGLASPPSAHATP